MASASVPVSRFADLNEDELNEILTNKASVNTKKATSYCYHLLIQYNKEKNQCERVPEDMSVEELDNLLQNFYASARTKKQEKYSASTIKNLRNGLKRFFNEPPYSRGYNFDKSDFPKSTQMYEAILVDLKRSGKAVIDHKPVINENDRGRLQLYFSNYASSSVILLRKVWYDIMIFFCRRGREGLRELTDTSYEVKVDSDGTKYVIKRGSELTKNHRNDGAETTTGGCMFEDPNCPNCPVKSYELYMTKRNKRNNNLFQYPSKSNVAVDAYENRTIGKNYLGSMMKTISQDAKLSQIYTNHSVRATSITILSELGYEGRHIQTMSKHKCLASLDNYWLDTSLKQKQTMSRSLTKSMYGPSSSQAPPTVTSKRSKPSCTATSMSNSNQSVSSAVSHQSPEGTSKKARNSESVMCENRSPDNRVVSTTQSDDDYGNFNILLDSPTFDNILAEITQTANVQSVNRNVNISNVSGGVFNIYNISKK